MCVHIDENDMDKRRVNHKLARKLVKQILVMDIIFKHILVEEKTFLFVRMGNPFISNNLS